MPLPDTTRRRLVCGGLAAAGLLALPPVARAAPRRLAYLSSDLRIPFWDILRRGVAAEAAARGYQFAAYSAENNPKRELENMVAAVRDKVDGIVLSPTNSSAAVTLLSLAEPAGIPVVIADIGTDGGRHVAYIASDNREGAYRIGKVLADALKARGWTAGTVGIIAIPQKRINGQVRTAGFMQAMEEAGIRSAGLRQQVDFSHKETYEHATSLLREHRDLRALWLQGSDRYQAALEAIRDAKRTGEVLLLCFDAEPEFLQMIPAGTLVGAAMQQPFLIGEASVRALDEHLAGKPVKAVQALPILAVSKANLQELLPAIRRNVLGIPAGAR